MTSSILLAFGGRSSSLFGREKHVLMTTMYGSHILDASADWGPQVAFQQASSGGKLFWGYATLWQKTCTLSSVAAKVAGSLCVHRSEYIYLYISGMRTWILLGSIEFSPNWNDHCRIKNLLEKVDWFYSVEKRPAKKSTSRYRLFFVPTRWKRRWLNQKKRPRNTTLAQKKKTRL